MEGPDCVRVVSATNQTENSYPIKRSSSVYCQNTQLLSQLLPMRFSEYSLKSLGGQAPEDSAGSPFLPAAPPYASPASSFQYSPRIGQGRERWRRICVLHKGEGKQVGRWIGGWAPASWACGRVLRRNQHWVSGPGFSQPEFSRETSPSSLLAVVRVAFSLCRSLTEERT